MRPRESGGAFLVGFLSMDLHLHPNNRPAIVGEDIILPRSTNRKTECTWANPYALKKQL